VKKEYSHRLLHVLTPRTDINDLLSLSNSSELAFTITDFTKQKTAMASMKSAGQQEISDMLKLRKRNRSKLDLAGATFCICHQIRSGTMVQCQLCCNLYHAKCVSYSEPVCADNVLPFLCPLCLRTQRPSLNTLLNLLVSLKELTLWVPEADAIEYLGNRTMGWLEQVRSLMSTDELLKAKRVINQSETAASPGISEVTLLTLEKLAVEGNLLEVTVSEKNTVNSILRYCCPTDYGQVVFGFPELLTAEDSILNTTKRTTKRKCAIAEKKPAQVSKRKKRLPKANENEADEEVEMSIDDTDELCAADTCLRPTGDVKWVQCDICQGWFHFRCVGLAAISEQEEYVCSQCKKSSVDNTLSARRNVDNSVAKPINLDSESDSEEISDEEEDTGDPIRDFYANENIDTYIIRSNNSDCCQSNSVKIDDVIMLE